MKHTFLTLRTGVLNQVSCSMATRQFNRSRREDIHGKILSKAVGILWNFEAPTRSVGTQTEGPRTSFFTRHSLYYVECPTSTDDKDTEFLVTDVQDKQCDNKVLNAIGEKEDREPNLDLPNVKDLRELNSSLGTQKPATNSDDENGFPAKERHPLLASLPPEVLTRVVELLNHKSQIRLSQTCNKF